MATFALHLEGDLTVLRRKKESLMAAIEERMGILGQQLYDKVAMKLSGEVLNVGTGALLGSVVLSAVEIAGGAMETFVEIPEGSPEWLIGRVHEYGGEGYYPIEPINAQALRFIAGGTLVFAKHVNHPPALERSYLRSSLDEMMGEVMAGLQETVDGVLEAA